MVKNLPAMQETHVRSLGWEDSLEKEVATHSSILAWRISRTEDPGGIKFMGLQTVRHDRVTNTKILILGSLGSTSYKEPASQSRTYIRHGFKAWVGKIPGGGNNNPLQSFCLENPMNRGPWRATVPGVAKS